MNWILEGMERNSHENSVIINEKCYTYAELLECISEWNLIINMSNVSPGDVVFLKGTISLDLISLIFSLSMNNNIIVPYSEKNKDREINLKEISAANYSINLDENEGFVKEKEKESHSLYEKLKEEPASGMVLFSSGTTGAPKAIVLNFNKILNKYKNISSKKRILSFLNYDHIGGLNTILYCLCTGGCIVIPKDKNVKNVMQVINRWNVEVLPTTPTFLNMVLMSGYLDKYDISSIKTITYGTEVMPKSTLYSLCNKLPNVKLKQTYGLSEVGILPTKSKDNNELWVKVGDKNIKYKIIDNVLWVKSPTAMLGYLNAKSDFDNDGYFNTQDTVEVDGEYMKLKGRVSDIINVAGEKVYPAEIETLILQFEEVQDVVISGEKNPITNNVVKATVHCSKDTDIIKLEQKIKKDLLNKIENYKRPLIYNFIHSKLHSERFKRLRTL